MLKGKAIEITLNAAEIIQADVITNMGVPNWIFDGVDIATDSSQGVVSLGSQPPLTQTNTKIETKVSIDEIAAHTITEANKGDIKNSNLKLILLQTAILRHLFKDSNLSREDYLSKQQKLQFLIEKQIQAINNGNTKFTLELGELIKEEKHGN